MGIQGEQQALSEAAKAVDRAAKSVLYLCIKNYEFCNFSVVFVEWKGCQSKVSLFLVTALSMVSFCCCRSIIMLGQQKVSGFRDRPSHSKHIEIVNL
jgi:hypothetical protein